jgi:hypothetical protein
MARRRRWFVTDDGECWINLDNVSDVDFDKDEKGNIVWALIYNGDPDTKRELEDEEAQQFFVALVKDNDAEADQ